MKRLLYIALGMLFSVLSFSQDKTGIGNVSSTTGGLIPNAIVKIVPVSNPGTLYEYAYDK